MATLKSIAERTRVSVATVSNVINGTAYVSPKLRGRVLQAIRELNYHPNAVARSLRTKTSKTVGMIIPDITNPFFPAVVRGAEDVLLQEDYTLILGNSDGDGEKEERYYQTFLAKRVDGLILIIAPSQSAPQYLRRHSKNQNAVPVVFADRFHRGLRGDTVFADNIGGAKQAISHLLDLGHRRIAIITGPLELANARMRLEGYNRALSERRLVPAPELVRSGKFDLQSGFAETLELLKLGQTPTAVFVSNALMTMGCLQALKESGVECPRDISLVSFDDLEWFALSDPTITAVSQPVYELGATAAEMLVKRITGRLSGPPYRKVLATTLVKRESTRAITVEESHDLGAVRL
jgi:LacI family transcriptional regulator